MRRIKLWFWKRLLRALYLEYVEYLDEIDAGAAITEYISGQVKRRDRLNRIIARINKLDPNANLSPLASPK